MGSRGAFAFKVISREWVCERAEQSRDGMGVGHRIMLSLCVAWRGRGWGRSRGAFALEVPSPVAQLVSHWNLSALKKNTMCSVVRWMQR